jgi:hypothetical protein
VPHRVKRDVELQDINAQFPVYLLHLLVRVEIANTAIKTNAVAVLSTQKLIYRHAGGLFCQVPEGGLDVADRVDGQPPVGVRRRDAGVGRDIMLRCSASMLVPPYPSGGL